MSILNGKPTGVTGPRSNRFANPLGFLAERPTMSLRQSMNWVYVAWGFGAVYFVLTMGTAQVAMGKAMGVGEFGFGVLAALPFAAAIAQLPAGYLLEKFGGHKRLFMTFGITHRALWVLIALVPWLEPTGWRAEAFIGLVGMSWLFGHFAAPAWQSWAGDLIPERVRGRYFARRNQLGNAVMLIASLPVGWLLDVATGAEGLFLSATLSLIFIVASVMGIIDLLCHGPVPADQGHRPNRHVRWRDLFALPLRDYGFRRFLAYHATIAFAIAMMGTYGMLYVLDVVLAGRSDKFVMATLIMGVWPPIVAMNSLGYWGKLNDRVGVKRVLVLGTTIAIPGGAMWLFVRPETWWLSFATNAIAAFGWTGVFLAINNMIMQVGSSRQSGKPREGQPQRLGSAFIAIDSIAVAVGGCAGGLFAGIVADRLTVGEVAWSGSLLGLPVSWHLVIMISSSLLRVCALGWLLGVREPRQINADGAVKIVVIRFAEHLSATATMPMRTLTWLRTTGVDMRRSPIARLGRTGAARYARRRRRRAA